MEVVEDQRPVHLYFNRSIASGYLDGLDWNLVNNLEYQIFVCEKWDELSKRLHLNPQSICFQHTDLEFCSASDIVQMVESLNKLTDHSERISITVGVSKNTNYSLIKELQKTDILGIVPCWRDFGISETIKALKEQWAGRSYWPKHIINELPGAVKKLPKLVQEIKLTTRQQQILDLLNQRGMTNKGIARHLNISESTVKLHMSSIFKKYGVRNRTQLAVFSQRQSTK